MQIMVLIGNLSNYSISIDSWLELQYFTTVPHYFSIVHYLCEWIEQIWKYEQTNNSDSGSDRSERKRKITIQIINWNQQLMR